MARGVQAAYLRTKGRMNPANTWHVYALKDPRDGTVRYVGTTHDLKHRLQGHQAERSDSRKSAWIAGLRTLNLSPEMCILESGDGGRNEQRSHPWSTFFWSGPVARVASNSPLNSSATLYSVVEF